MKPRILVIDDEAAIRDSLRMILEYEDYQFVGAGSGQDGVSLVAARAARPGAARHQDARHGRHARCWRKLRAFDETLPVVMISGHGDRSHGRGGDRAAAPSTSSRSR